MTKRLKKPASELRLDAVSQNWIIIASGRAKRPETFAVKKRVKEKVSKRGCPFCHLETQPPILYRYPRGKNWRVVSIPNKYPALSKEKDLIIRKVGPYQVMNGIGFCEVIITRDHHRQLAQFSKKEIKEVIDCYHERLLDLMNEKFVSYVVVFHNHGQRAGASVYHPHSQIIALPVIDTDLKRSLTGAERYYKSHKKCVHCTMVGWERKDRQRIIFENKEFIVLCPYISRVAFEVRIYPKKHLPYFERIKNGEKEYLAEAFQQALSKLYKGLSDPPYNFFLLTAPCDGKNYNYYHWHWEIRPKTGVLAGFELGTGMEISTIEPEKAAEYLRKQK